MSAIVSSAARRGQASAASSGRRRTTRADEEREHQNDVGEQTERVVSRHIRVKPQRVVLRVEETVVPRTLRVNGASL